MIAPPSEAGVEEVIVATVLWLRLVIEAIGAAIIGAGMAQAVLGFAGSAFPPQAADFARVRLTLARFLSIALEFQLGADILSTAVAPTWDAIGKLGAIAVIRTALNYFLSREMHEETEASYVSGAGRLDHAIAGTAPRLADGDRRIS